MKNVSELENIPPVVTIINRINKNHTKRVKNKRVVENFCTYIQLITTSCSAVHIKPPNIILIRAVELAIVQRPGSSAIFLLQHSYSCSHLDN